jgi:DNA-directed RNA polymerase specialized sigma24 family protein
MGRKRYFRRLKKMDPLYRLVFRYFYWENMRFCEIAEQLKTIYGARHVSHRDISGILARVNKEIGPQNIWRSILSNRTGMNHPARFDEDILPRRTCGEEALPGFKSEADIKYLAGETTALFENMLNFLNREEKRMLRLFFWENRTAKNIAGLLDLDNEFVAYQKRDGILKRMKKGLEKLGLGFSDFSSVMDKMNIRIDGR